MSAHTLDSTSVVMVDGVLDSTTYRPLRDTIIEMALNEPRAVIIDITDLQVPDESALAVFTSARWHVSVWPDVPLVLVCRHGNGRAAIARNGIAKYVPVYPTIEDARDWVAALGIATPRLRAQVQLPPVHSSLHRARELAAEWLLAWWQPESIAVTSIVVDVLVENVLEHTQSAPGLLIETRGDVVTIAVEDHSRLPAVRHEDPHQGADTVSGLAVVAAVTRAWGSTPTSTGKTVWAVIGPENCL
ncbi:STAS domain-containing protein [Mycolicibacterium sp. XJ870]